MVDDDPDVAGGRDRGPGPSGAPRRRWRWLAAAGGLAALTLGLAWVDRVDIARRLIDRQVRQLKLSAHYRIDAIGPRREVLSNIAFGDPAHPDLTVETIEIDTGWRGGLPAITGLTVIGARLHGTIAGGRLSFGSLDRWLLAPSPAPFRLPDLALDLRDARVSIGGAHGAIGLAGSGAGTLRNGFVGAVALVAPDLAAGGCDARTVSFAGRVATADGQPRVTGPVRIARLSCPRAGLRVDRPEVAVDTWLAPTLDAASGQVALATGAVRGAGANAAGLRGTGSGDFAHGVLAADVTLGGAGVTSAAARAARLAVAGRLRIDSRRGSLFGEGTFSGGGLVAGAGADAALARGVAAAGGTMIAPLLASARAGLRATAGSALTGRWLMRRGARGTSLFVPEAHFAAARAGRWLSLTGVSAQRPAGGGPPMLTGAFALAGPALPPLRGEIGALPGGALRATLTMPGWRAGSAALALPGLIVRRTADGAVGFDGMAVLSGPVPGGRIGGLRVPLTGRWSAVDGLRLGDRCAALGVDRLDFGTLRLAPAGGRGDPLTVCPPAPGTAIVTIDRRGTRVAMRSAGVRLAGQMGASAVTLTSGALALAWPGDAAARDIDASMADPARGASHVRLAHLTASVGGVTTGRFAGGEVSLAGAPAALRALAGGFRWADGRLSVTQGAFRIEDPAAWPAFAAVVARDAALSLHAGVVDATASLQTSTTPRELARVAVMHDLARGIGHADVTVPGLVFDRALQPKQLSPLAEGVIADVRGTLSGAGRFDWAGGHVASHGWLATAGLDFAAPFGPVKGLAGRVEFTDLLALVTAPDQRVTIAAINPGIEVDDGVLTFAVQPGHVLVIDGARWPFLDGRLALLPTRLALGASETRRYELRVDGLNAARFVTRMDLSNLAATGTFDGNLPLVFDETGGHIDGGLLLSRPPGGTVSYVGDLTYKDLSPMANYAFRALRALKYRQMRIAMDGALAGDIVTRVSMAGVGQGPGAKRNFITDQIARLPIRFDVTITAPFVQLMTSFRALYDPALAADPRTLGLIDAQGRPIVHPPGGASPPAASPPPPAPSRTPPSPKAIQP